MNEEQKKKEERMGNKRKKEQTLIGSIGSSVVVEQRGRIERRKLISGCIVKLI